ncbi:MAG: class I SAM-dependent methyltransferase [Gammaproteobacteria bacterium]|jgi:hypothetical protein|nr:class I SAM-dependent methyltransferase [Gammaproteobacteria bacterium]MBT4860514.1 class I SAM-dependent methyltransferase [Gammaproteobacteria bacterium]
MDNTAAQPLKLNSSLQQRGESLSEVSDKIGCGTYRFEKTGRTQLEALLRNGLNPWDKFLDIGCGAFCGGYWVMHFLNEGGYHGIEPNVDMFNGGLSYILEPGLVELKKPRFNHNDQYDISVFDTKFDYLFAQSIWTHAGKKDIEKMLNGFKKYGNDNARFLTTVKFPDLFHKDYKEDAWVGGSHESSIKGTVRHSFKWIQEACSKRGLRVKKLGEKINTQHLILIEK